MKKKKKFIKLTRFDKIIVTVDKIDGNNKNLLQKPSFKVGLYLIYRLYLRAIHPVDRAFNLYPNNRVFNMAMYQAVACWKPTGQLINSLIIFHLILNS